MEKIKQISHKTDIPLDILNPYVKENFGETLSEHNIMKYVIKKMYPLYHDFNMYTKVSRAIVARGLFPSEDDPLLTSIDSLTNLKLKLNSSELLQTYSFRMRSDYYKRLVNISLSNAQIESYVKEKNSEQKILSEITKNALSYYYWCIQNISEGRRIGHVGYSNNQPDITGPFIELMMDIHFHIYDKKKAYSFDLEDFLRNASEEVIGDRLIDMLSDFKKEYKMHGITPVLARMQFQIEKFGKRLKWNPNDCLYQMINNNLNSKQ